MKWRGAVEGLGDPALGHGKGMRGREVRNGDGAVAGLGVECRVAVGDGELSAALAEVVVGEVNQVLADSFPLKIRVNRHRGQQENLRLRLREMQPGEEQAADERVPIERAKPPQIRPREALEIARNEPTYCARLCFAFGLMEGGSNELDGGFAICGGEGSVVHVKMEGPRRQPPGAHWGQSTISTRKVSPCLI